MGMINVLVVDDHMVVRSGLKTLLDGKHEIRVIGEAADGEEAIEKVKELAPDVVLMDLSMPHGMGGLEATTELKKTAPSVSVLILTMHDDEEYLFQAIHAGASGYLLKSAPHEDLVSAITSVSAGEAYLSPEATKKLMNQYNEGKSSSSFEVLSEREREVLEFIAKGYSNKEIGEQLVISVKTVESHKSNLMEKLGLKTKPDLVKYASKKGLIKFD